LKETKHFMKPKKKAIEAYIKAQNTKQFMAAEYGFWYSQDTVLGAEASKLPEFGDIVNFNFNLSTLDSTLIYTMVELKTRDYAMDQEALFTGLREGLKVMRAGETFTFIFPSQKAYGYYGDENRIGRNTPLISIVTVNTITNK
ncbi:MAG: FKBP-type peptidyl-prolyl cis-trans isomerase, partial [Lacinutrix sp.]|uniref:FKBP-type peptidyl-prolyl cis-trans isomerase n=1 Tax=Lacinutrix sp. TaxID=1937692 RepID=UPI00309FC937